MKSKEIVRSGVCFVGFLCVMNYAMKAAEFVWIKIDEAIQTSKEKKQCSSEPTE